MLTCAHLFEHFRIGVERHARDLKLKLQLRYVFFLVSHIFTVYKMRFDLHCIIDEVSYEHKTQCHMKKKTQYYIMNMGEDEFQNQDLKNNKDKIKIRFQMGSNLLFKEQ